MKTTYSLTKSLLAAELIESVGGMCSFDLFMCRLDQEGRTVRQCEIIDKIADLCPAMPWTYQAFYSFVIDQRT